MMELLTKINELAAKNKEIGLTSAEYNNVINYVSNTYSKFVVKC